MYTWMTSWKNKLIDESGRVALFSLVLTSIHSYYMNNIWLPQSIHDTIYQMTCIYIGKGTCNTKLIRLVGKKYLAWRRWVTLGFNYLEMPTHHFLINSFGTCSKKLINFREVSSPTSTCLVLIGFIFLLP